MTNVTKKGNDAVANLSMARREIPTEELEVRLLVHPSSQSSEDGKGSITVAVFR